MADFFSRSSLIYPLSALIIAILNWLFWVIVAKMIGANELGLASSILSIPILFSGIAMLGFEVSLAKESSKDKSFFGSTLFFEIIVHLSLIPLLLFLFQQTQIESNMVIIGILLLLQAFLILVPRFALLGIFSIKSVMIFDLIGTLGKIISLVILLSLDYGVIGILFSVIIQGVIIVPPLLILSSKKFGFKIKIQSLKLLLRHSIANFPTKVSAIIQYAGIIVILTFLEISNEVIAGITISLMFFRFIGLIPAGFAQIALSSSSIEEKDFSTSSLKIGSALMSPIITLMITVPALILSIYDDEYIKYSNILLVLGIGMIPFILSINIRTMLNNQNLLKKLAILGILESILIVVLVFFFVPIMGEIAVAWSVTIAMIISGILSLQWANTIMKKIFLKGAGAILIGVLVGLITFQIFSNEYIVAVLSFSTTLIFMFIFRNITISEIVFILEKIKSK